MYAGLKSLEFLKNIHMLVHSAKQHPQRVRSEFTASSQRETATTASSQRVHSTAGSQRVHSHLGTKLSSAASGHEKQKEASSIQKPAGHERGSIRPERRPEAN